MYVDYTTLSTLAKEYNFKDVCDNIPTNKQTVNLLTEKLCTIELRADKLASVEAMAMIEQNKFPCNNSVTGLRSDLKSSTMLETEVANRLQRMHF